MGRQRKHHRHQWPDEDIIELLSQLDYLIYQKSPPSFANLNNNQINSEIEKMLQELKKDYWTTTIYSTVQLKSKLVTLYEEGDPEHHKWNFTCIFHHGSKKMYALDEKMREAIESRYRMLIDSNRTPRRKRATVQTLQRDPPRKRKASEKHSPGRRRKKRTFTAALQDSTTRTVSPCETTFERQTPHTGHDNMHWQKLITTPPLSSRTNDRKSIDRLHPQCAGSLTPNCFPQREIAETPTPIPPLSLGTFDRLEVTTVAAISPTPIDIPEITMTIREHEELLQDLSYFRAAFTQTEAELKNLKRERLEAEALVNKINGIPLDVQKELRIKNSRISDLKDRLHNTAFAKPFFTLDAMEQVATDSSKLKTKHASLRSRMMAISTIHGFQCPEPCNMFEQPLDLRNLWHVGPPFTAARGDNISVNHIIQSLVGAAICQWVFEEKFQCTAMLKSPVLEQYRHHIVSLCGEKVLRGFDFAAHQSLIDDSHFQDSVLPRMASQLTERFFVAVQPFLVENQCTETNVRFRPILEGIFRDALDIKIAVMVSKDMYECIWPAPDSVFEKRSMETERSKYHREEPEGFRSDSRVRLPLVPGLAVYDHDRAMVDYYGFQRSDNAAAGSRRIIAKAIVLI